MSIKIQREISQILIEDVKFNLDEKSFESEFELHIIKKRMFHELVEGEANFEEILEALESFVGTSNMDVYLIDVCPQLDRLCDLYGMPD